MSSLKRGTDADPHHIQQYQLLPSMKPSSPPLRHPFFPPQPYFFLPYSTASPRSLPMSPSKHFAPRPPEFPTIPAFYAADNHRTRSIPRCPSAFPIPQSVRIVEVAPRDGLQNESRLVDTATKIALVHDLVDAGLRTVEVTAFVSPRRVPQLADASHVMSAISKRKAVSYPVLVPNLKGFHAALAAGANEIAVFAGATEKFSQNNINCSIQQSIDRFRAVATAAHAHRIKVRAYISCVVGCPYEGAVDPEAVADIAVALTQIGCYEISLGDTIGVGNPKSIVTLINAVLRRGVPVSALAIHCHDTRGTALANVLAAMSVGVSVIDSSVAGLGGCPFAPGAAGNLATEDLVYMLRGMDIDIGPIDLEKLSNIGKRICNYLGRESRSRVSAVAQIPSKLSPTSPTT